MNKRMTPIACSFMTVLMTATASLAAQTGSGLYAASAVSWTGEYEGHVICDRVRDGSGSNFGVEVSVGIVQKGDELHVAVRSAFDGGDRPPGSLYHGLLRQSRSGDVASGFLEACRPSFPYKEQMRIFPATPSRAGFGFAADSIFISDGMPGAEGELIVESCKWSLDRVSLQAPVIEFCSARPSARPTDQGESPRKRRATP